MQAVIVNRCCSTVQYVTRAVRVVDLITNLDMQAFQQYGGMAAFINRLQVSQCHQLGITFLCENEENEKCSDGRQFLLHKTR